MFLLSKKTVRLLRKAKWTENRRVDIEEFVSKLRQEGYEVPEPVEEFLRRFGGIRVVHRNPKLRGYSSVLHFDAAAALERVFKSTVDEYSKAVDEQLCVIGEADNGYLTLMMGPSGRMYAGQDEFLYLAGENGEQGVDKLCSYDDLEPIEFV